MFYTQRDGKSCPVLENIPIIARARYLNRSHLTSGGQEWPIRDTPIWGLVFTDSSWLALPSDLTRVFQTGLDILRLKMLWANATVKKGLSRMSWNKETVPINQEPKTIVLLLCASQDGTHSKCNLAPGDTINPIPAPPAFSAQTSPLPVDYGCFPKIRLHFKDHRQNPREESFSPFKLSKKPGFSTWTKDRQKTTLHTAWSTLDVNETSERPGPSQELWNSPPFF